ncbi:DUF551 domain-containing protein [Klebsiella pneumoniae]|uniref:DUF551 domain-containing protein n=1 Tax=Klebsiella pneumoniae TaxID=573 RepID=UPI0020CCF2F8|nr:DUF551 domain-containing protein [Klebsiella pneumoniae]
MTKSTITRERLEKIKSWRETYGAGSNVMLPAEEAEELACLALAAIDSKPAAEVVSIYGDPEAFGEREIRPLIGIQQMPYGTKLYRHAQPVPVVPEDVLNRLEHEANHITAWHHMDEHSCKVNRRDLLTLVNSCRSAMHQAGSSPVIPDGYVMVPMRLTAENGAKGALSGEFSETKFVNCPECFGDDECETCDGSGRIEITVPVTWTTIKEIWAKGVEHFAAAPQSPGGDHATVPGKWIPVSERVPTKQDGSVFLTWNGQYIGKELFLMGSFQCLKPEIITHWMRLPAVPQEVKGE